MIRAAHDGMAALIGCSVGWTPWERKVALVLSCYLDDSGETSDPVITMAGYLAPAPKWDGFEPRAREYLDHQNIPYLHTVDLLRGRNAFEGWDWDKKAAFANGLFDILRDHVGFGIEFSVLKSTYHQRKKDTKLNHNISAYGFCFMGVLDKLHKDERVQEVLEHPEVDISFFVECGNKNDQDVHQVFKRAQKHKNGEKLKAISFVDKRKFIALQMADFLAYFSRRIRTRDRSSSHYQEEMDFLISVTEGIDHVRFLATDFYGS